MNGLTRLTVVLVLSFGCADLNVVPGQTSTAAEQTKAARKAPGATVSGRVTLQGKGKGEIVVGLRTSDFRPQFAPAFKATTDPDGNYRLTDIPAGNYQILPLTPAYVVSDSISFGSRGKTLILAEGERVEDIDFSLIRGSVITGKVTQRDGKPLIEERVYLLAADQNNPGGSTGTAFQTDDRGVYRMFGIRPGRYKLSVGLPEEAFTPNRRGPTYERVFYPSVSDFADAKVVEVGEGTEATNIDIAVGQILETFAASGIIIDGVTDQPVPNVRFGLQRILGSNSAPFVGTNTTSNMRGEFRFENLTPGKYSIFLIPAENGEINADPLRFEIVNQDVTGLILQSSKGAVVSGVVVLEGKRDKELSARLAKLRLSAFVRGGEGSSTGGFGRTATIGIEGNFRFGGLQPGSLSLLLVSSDFGSQTGFVISRIERDGVVQPRNGVEIRAGEQISDLRIIVNYGNGSVRGSVKWANGPPPAGVRMMVRLTKPDETSTPIRPQEVDARGHFIFQGIPPGTYELNFNAFIPQSRARQPSVRQLVTVTDGVVTEVELVVNTNAETPSIP